MGGIVDWGVHRYVHARLKAVLIEHCGWETSLIGGVHRYVHARLKAGALLGIGDDGIAGWGECLIAWTIMHGSGRPLGSGDVPFAESGKFWAEPGHGGEGRRL